MRIASAPAAAAARASSRGEEPLRLAPLVLREQCDVRLDLLLDLGRPPELAGFGDALLLLSLLFRSGGEVSVLLGVSHLDEEVLLDLHRRPLPNGTLREASGIETTGAVDRQLSRLGMVKMEEDVVLEEVRRFEEQSESRSVKRDEGNAISSPKVLYDICKRGQDRHEEVQRLIGLFRDQILGQEREQLEELVPISGLSCGRPVERTPIGERLAGQLRPDLILQNPRRLLPAGRVAPERNRVRLWDSSGVYGNPSRGSDRQLGLQIRNLRTLLNELGLQIFQLLTEHRLLILSSLSC